MTPLAVSAVQLSEVMGRLFKVRRPVAHVVMRTGDSESGKMMRCRDNHTGIYLAPVCLTSCLFVECTL